MNIIRPTMLSLALSLAVAVPVVVAAGALPDPAGSRFEQALEVHDLGPLQEFVDEAALRQVSAMEHVTQKIEAFLVATNAVGVEIAEATNAWIANPMPESEAALTRAVAHGAARSKRASEEVTRIKDEVSQLTRDLQAGLQGERQKQASMIEKARQQTQSESATLAQAKNAVMNAKRLLEVQGAFASGAIPPELEDQLFRLAVDYRELALRVDISRGVEARLAESNAILDQAERDYTEINRLVGLVSYQAASAGRLFGLIGLAESTRIRTTLVTRAYSQGREIRAQLSNSLQQIRSMATVHRLLRAHQLPRNGVQVPPQKSAGAHVTATDLLEWFRTIGEEDTPHAKKAHHE